MTSPVPTSPHAFGGLFGTNRICTVAAGETVLAALDRVLAGLIRRRILGAGNIHGFGAFSIPSCGMSRLLERLGGKRIADLTTLRCSEQSARQQQQRSWNNAFDPNALVRRLG